MLDPDALLLRPGQQRAADVFKKMGSGSFTAEPTI
jgi:hypothetical protein